MPGEIRLPSSHPLHRQIGLLGLTEAALTLLRRIQPHILPYMKDVTRSFYSQITDINELRDMIMAHSTLERLHSTLERHVSEMFNGLIDHAYIMKRIKIAEMHPPARFLQTRLFGKRNPAQLHQFDMDDYTRKGIL
ncbi:protoglobin domain-containing protein [Paenibacillus thiaminolyticus]|uniref:protoglobin domain-containing protein n=1 Tax=Paenibacillus thiaminolyticus TaxID=49283 RepID=UPI0025430552|nr:protoglobin domain-containing protein [Paenibacillus thiaminolyticus]WII37120.1 protoglobin domain-containing protein [Paenibacillus thiaminolyticus]